MATIWIARSSPWDFFVAGIKRYKVFFHEPHFEEPMFECPMFGPLSWDQYRHGEWLSEHGKYIYYDNIRKICPELDDRVWQDSLDCYIDVPDKDDPYTHLREVHDDTLKPLLNRITPDDNSVAEKARWAAEVNQCHITAEKAIERPGRGWREHLLKYNISLSLLD